MLHFKRGWNSLAPIFHSMFQLIFWFLFFVWDPGRGYWPWTELGRKRIYLCTLNTHCSETAQIAQTLNTHCAETAQIVSFTFFGLCDSKAPYKLCWTHIGNLSKCLSTNSSWLTQTTSPTTVPSKITLYFKKKIQAFNIFNAPLKSKGFVFSSSQTPLRFVKRPNYSTLCGPVSSHLWSFTAKKQESAIFTPSALSLSLHETQTFWPSFNASFCRDFLRWLQYEIRPKGTSLFYPPPTPAMAADQIFFIVCPWLWQIDDVCKRQRAAVQ